MHSPCSSRTGHVGLPNSQNLYTPSQAIHNSVAQPSSGLEQPHGCQMENNLTTAQHFLYTLTHAFGYHEEVRDGHEEVDDVVLDDEDHVTLTSTTAVTNTRTISTRLATSRSRRTAGTLQRTNHTTLGHILARTRTRATSTITKTH